MGNPYTTGLDVLVPQGVTLDVLINAIHQVAALPINAIVRPEHADDWVNVIDSDAANHWAVIHAYAVGDVAFKVDFGGARARDHHAIARALARQMNHPVAWPDESTLSPVACVWFNPATGLEAPCVIDDVDDAGNLDGLSVLLQTQ